MTRVQSRHRQPGSGRLLHTYVARHWGALAGAGVSTVALTAAELAAPWPLKLALDELISGRGAHFELTAPDFALLLALGALVLVIALVDALATFYSSFWLNRAGERIVHELRVATYAHLQRLSLAYHASRPKGDLVARVTGDVNAVGDLFAQTLGTLASAVLILIGMFTVTFLIDPFLACVAFLVTPLLFAITLHYQRLIKLMARAQRAREGEIASMATEALSAMHVVKAFGTETFEHDRVQQRSAERLEAGVQVSRVEARFSALVDILGSLATALVLGLGVLSVAAGHISPGDLVVVVAYTNRLYRPLRDIAKQTGRAARAFARLDRIAEVLASDMMLQDRATGPEPGRSHGDVQLVDVSFRYVPDRPVLDGLTLSVAAGSRLAIVGESGAGKSTVGALVARFYDPTRGEVLLDGRDAREVPLSWLRDQVGVLLQDTILFSGTVLDNIAYGSCTDLEAVEEAARAACAFQFISRLPDGFHTALGPGGLGLSGGQRQRIGIARVLLRDPPILVLDEPTAGLDADSEAMVMLGLSRLAEGRTTILITHSTALARTADRIAVMADGRVVEHDVPEKLLAQDSLFRRMSRVQAMPAGIAGAGPPPRIGELQLGASRSAERS